MESQPITAIPAGAFAALGGHPAMPPSMHAPPSPARRPTPTFEDELNRLRAEVAALAAAVAQISNPAPPKPLKSQSSPPSP